MDEEKAWISQSQDGDRTAFESLIRIHQRMIHSLTYRMTVYDELSHAEAAKALGCAEATVSWRVFAARRKLRRWLASTGGVQ